MLTGFGQLSVGYHTSYEWVIDEVVWRLSTELSTQAGPRIHQSPVDSRLGRPVGLESIVLDVLDVLDVLVSHCSRSVCG